MKNSSPRFVSELFHELMPRFQIGQTEAKKRTLEHEISAWEKEERCNAFDGIVQGGEKGFFIVIVLRFDGNTCKESAAKYRVKLISSLIVFKKKKV